MERIKIDTLRFRKNEEVIKVRNNREQLIADIVNATNERDKKKLAKAIAIAVNTQKWSEMDLHALLKKKGDPTLKNYTAFVWWSIKSKKK